MKFTRKSNYDIGKEIEIMALERKQQLWHWKGNRNYGIGKEITIMALENK